MMGRREGERERECVCVCVRERERQEMRYVTFCDAVAPMALWKRKFLAREDFSTSEVHTGERKPRGRFLVRKHLLRGDCEEMADVCTSKTRFPFTLGFSTLGKIGRGIVPLVDILSFVSKQISNRIVNE